MEEYKPQEEQHIFDNYGPLLTRATSGQRLANYFIDLVTFYIFMYFFSYVIVEVNMDLAIIMYGGEDVWLARLIYLLFYGMYMGLIETIFKGRSLGKLITGTVAVYNDGSRISGQTALLRGLCRAVPFNAFSGLGEFCNPWHDRWSKTFVVNFKDLNRN